jgi:hypothetical protein
LDSQYAAETENLREIVSENWRSLKDVIVHRGDTMRSEPSERMLSETWYFNDPVGSVYIKGCVDGSGTNKSLFGLIYASEHPNFDTEAPLGTLQIEQPSNGMVSASTVAI